MFNITKSCGSDSILIRPGSDHPPMQQEKNSALDPELINIGTDPTQTPIHQKSTEPSWWLLLIPIIGWIIYGAEKLMSSSTENLQGRVSVKDTAKNLIDFLRSRRPSRLEAYGELGDKEFLEKNWKKYLNQGFKFGQETLRHSEDDLAQLEEAITTWAQKHEHPKEAVEFAQRGILTHLFTDPLLCDSSKKLFKKLQNAINAEFGDNTSGKKAYKLASVEFFQEDTSVLSTFVYNRDNQEQNFTMKFTFTDKSNGEFMFQVDRSDSRRLYDFFRT